jgi:hypothetical protein
VVAETRRDFAVGDMVRFQASFGHRSGRIVRRARFPRAWVVELDGGWLGRRQRAILERRLTPALPASGIKPGQRARVVGGVLRGTEGTIVRPVWWFGKRVWLLETASKSGRPLYSRVGENFLELLDSEGPSVNAPSSP